MCSSATKPQPASPTLIFAIAVVPRCRCAVPHYSETPLRSHATRDGMPRSAVSADLYDPRVNQSSGGVKMIKTILVGAALAAVTTGALAQDKRPDYGTDINAAGAKKIAAEVLAECQKNQWNVAVAVVDNHGFLVYFERMDNTQTASMDIAVGKARSAATYRRPTRAFVAAINKGSPATAPLPGGFASPGGSPIMVDGKVTGRG